jgi:TetR/AcrR family transcriptional repressor of nem operon
MKQYDRGELLERAVRLFHRQGYNGTSTAELVEALGVNRKSMYAEFGSKLGLFEATLKHYDERYLSGALAPVEGDGAGIAGIRTAFDNYARAVAGRMSGLGCLLCNTAVERAALDPVIAPYVDRYLERVRRGFRHALANAQAAGELAGSADLDRLAAFFTMSLVGVAASVRARAAPDEVRAACDVALGVLDAHRPT